MQEIRRQREWLETGLTAALREVDKLVVSVSSAVLALSVAFVGQIEVPLETWTIKAAWTLFISAILSVVLSLVFEQIERYTRIKKIDVAIKSGNQNHRDVAGPWGKVVLGLNFAGLACFIAGLVLLAMFLSASLS